MSNKLIIKIFCASLCFLIIVAVCGCSKEKSHIDEEHLKIGLTPAVDAIPYIIAQDKGIFKKYGLRVDMEVFKSAGERDAAFQSSNIDGVLCDMVAVCLYRNAGFKVKITGVTDGDFILLASKQSGIKSIKEVKGHQVAISENTIIEYALDKILNKNGIGINDVKKVAVPSIPVRLEMLQHNKVQLALLPEPFSSMAIKQGAVVLDSAYKNNIYSNVIAFKESTIKEKASVIKKLNEAYNESVKYLKENPIEEYQDQVIKFIGYPEDMKGSIVLPDYRKTELPGNSELKSTIEWAEKENLLNKKITENDLKAEIE
ncbi:ABC transporter substrate-binding protein [Ruminiclostridium josui]|uniref:ABC transporter substrate-binding protein n=1 Tax=Ruminiclostridium josui TaxID=1499 RepID=UPI000464A99D|nr:MetQ/NlpA family ABC transporter substrate-binding protein [Ruminiclostridium josui]